MRSLATAEGDSIRQACEKIDRSHTGHVGRHDFRRILHDHGFVMTDVAFRRVAHFVNASKVRRRMADRRKRSGRGCLQSSVALSLPPHLMQPPLIFFFLNRTTRLTMIWSLHIMATLTCGLCPKAQAPAAAQTLACLRRARPLLSTWLVPPAPGACIRAYIHSFVSTSINSPVAL